MAGKGKTPDPPRLYKLKNGAPRGAGRMKGRVPAGRPSCPKWLDAEAKAKWKEVVPLLEAAGVLTKLDRAILTAYCVAWSELIEATRILAAEGRTCRSEAGTLKTHPAVGMQRSAMNTLRLVGASLGLTPEGRLRLHVDVDQAGPESGKARFFGGQAPVGPRVREPSRLMPPDAGKDE
jgi:P27 family predicted phage terminase small subunit